MKHASIAVLLLTIGADCGLVQSACSQGVAISGQVRLRSEADDRGLASTETVFAHLLRSRLRATANIDSGATVVLELQDARFLGSGNPALARGTVDVTADALDMKLAYARLRRPLDLPIDLVLGRQELSFANERLIGAFGWSNTGRSFDAARLTLHASTDVTVDAWGARLSAPVAGPTASQNLYGLWGTWSSGSVLGVDLYALVDDNTTPMRTGVDSAKSILSRASLGSSVRATIGPLRAELEGAVQTGDGAATDSTPRLSMRAFLASITLSVQVDESTGTRITALGTVLSGDGAATDDRNETFNTLFATNHKFYGSMDYFPALSGDLGLVDLGGGVAADLGRDVRSSLEGHFFAPQRRSSESFGSEIDVTVTWKRSRMFEFSAGASIMFPSELLKSRLGDQSRYWGFASGTWGF